MSTRLLTISLFLNLLLVGVAGYQFGRIDSGRRSSQKANPRLETQMSDAVPAGPTDAVTTSPLKWSEIESQDYAIYIANLRKAGCPEPVLRRIIHAELTELYAKKSFALTREFHSDFWKIAARSNIWEKEI